ncbi:MAG: hypothetical protein ABS865_09265 [Desemzia incerta]
MKKIIHAIIYGHSDGSERLVNQGEIKQIGGKLPESGEKSDHCMEE